MTRWLAPQTTGPLRGTVSVPGSKSATARALVIAALADQPSVLHGVLESRDSTLMRQGLTALGASFVDDLAGLRVEPIKQIATGAMIDCGLAGTVLRFLPPIAALGQGTTGFVGDPQAANRPVAPLLAALAELGATVSEPYRLPFYVAGSELLLGGTVHVDASGSSQFVSGLLLAGAWFEDGLTVINTSEQLPSYPHIEMTIAMLRASGVQVTDSPGLPHTWRVAPGPISGGDRWIEPDLTNAATLLAAALVAGGELSAVWPKHTVQPGSQLLAVLEAFGAAISVTEIASANDEIGNSSGVYRGAEPQLVRLSGQLRGADVHLGEVSELTPVAAALAVLADSPSTISGVAHIRGHETDRLAALATELTALGAQVSETADGLVITPAPLRPARDFHTYGDHRMAHAAALIGLVTPGIVVDDIGVTTKTLTDFPDLWQRLLGGSR